MNPGDEAWRNLGGTGELMRNGTIGGSGEAETIGKERVKNVSLKYKKYNYKEALGIIAT